MSSELFTVLAQTSNTAYVAQLTTATSGTCLLESSLWSGFATSIRIPKGCALKVWESKIKSHHPATVLIQVATSSAVMTSNYTIGTDSVWTSGAEQRTSRSGRPLVVESHDGQAAVRFQFDGAYAGSTFISSVVLATYNIEIVEMDKE
jgi:ribosomal protein L35AE/L33A